MATKDNKGFQDVLSTILVIVVVIIGIKIYFSVNSIGVYDMPEGKIYVGESDGLNYILATTAPDSANIYIYEAETSLVNRGVWLKCKQSTIEYNKLFGKLHIHPDINLLFWKYISFFDSEAEIRAKGKMVFSDAKQINFSNYDKNLLGDFYDTIIEKDSMMIFSDIELVEASGSVLEKATAVIDYFERYAY